MSEVVINLTMRRTGNSVSMGNPIVVSCIEWPLKTVKKDLEHDEKLKWLETCLAFRIF